MKFFHIAHGLAVAATLSVSVFTSAMAADYTVKDVTVSNPWARASAKMAKAGAAFLTIKNAGSADRLIAAKAAVAKAVEIHNHIHEDGMMRMVRVDGVDVPAKGTAMLQPGSYHVMFIGLNGPLEQGSHFPLTLVFEQAGEVTVDVEVLKMGAKGPMTQGAMPNTPMQHGKMMNQ